MWHAGGAGHESELNCVSCVLVLCDTQAQRHEGEQIVMHAVCVAVVWNAEGTEARSEQIVVCWVLCAGAVYVARHVGGTGARGQTKCRVLCITAMWGHVR